MKKIFIFSVSVLILGAGIALAGYCIACVVPGSEARIRSSLSPVEVVQTFVVRSGSCGALKLNDFTSPIPDDQMILLYREDVDYLARKYETEDGYKSIADDSRPIYLKFISKEFPRFLCDQKYAFGRLLDETIEGDRAKVTVDFLRPDGTFAPDWTFRLLRNEDGWHAYYLEGPKNKSNRPLRYLPERFKDASTVTPGEKTNSDAKLRFRSRY